MPIPPPPKLKLHHRTPNWVSHGEYFHIRLRVGDAQSDSLISSSLATTLLDSARFYHERGRWHCRLFLLMPDHLHSLLAFPPAASMSRVIGDWKKYHSIAGRVSWQKGYFDHRLRNDQELDVKAMYIRQNPVAKGLCHRPEEWPWVIDTQSV